MSIVPYIEETDGQSYFKVRVVRKSSKNPSHRVDKTLLGFKTEADAQKAEMRLLVECERALAKLESRGVIFGDLVDEWELAARKGDIFIRELSRQTSSDYVFVIRKYCDEWMKLSVHEIDRARAWVLLDRVEREVSVISRKRFRTAVDAVFKWGLLSGRIKNMTSIPTEGFSSTRKDEEKLPEILNLEQIRTLLRYAEELQHPWYPHWALALYTGMRSGELYALEW